MMAVEWIMIIIIGIVVSKLFFYALMIRADHSSSASMRRSVVQGVGRESRTGVRTT